MPMTAPDTQPSPETRLFNALDFLLKETFFLPQSAFMRINPDAIEDAHAALSYAASVRASKQAELDGENKKL